MSTPTTSTATPTTQTPASPATPTTGAPAATPAAEAAVARMLKLKVDGQDLELPESEVISLAQQGKSANKRFQEAATTRKEAEQIIAYAKANPAEFFKKTGQNARQWAEDFLLGEIQREQMSPEQKKAYENEEQLKKYRAQEKAAKDKAEFDRQQALENHHMQTYDQLFVKALTESGLPKTPYTVARMAQLEMVNVKKGLGLDASQLAKLVREDYVSEQKALFSSLDGDAMLEFLGKEAVKKMGKAQVSKYKAGKSNGSATRKAVESTDNTPNPITSWKEFTKKTRSSL